MIWQVLALVEVTMINKHFSQAKQLTASLLSAIKHQAQVHGLHYSLSVELQPHLAEGWVFETVKAQDNATSCTPHHTVMKSPVGVTRGMFAPLLFS